jgi:site-specific DNA-adenine methylase
MTSYHGGKKRIGKKLAEVIYEESIDISEDEKWNIKGYCEPFSGMMGVYQRIPELFKDYKPKLKYKAGDTNKSLIMMWESTQKGWKPSSKVTTRKEFMKMKDDGKSSGNKGFIGHFYGFSGQYFQPFKKRGVATLRNTIKKIEKISEQLENVSFSSGSYTQYSKLKNFVIYCDPPYQVQAHYYDEDRKHLSFDHDKFWMWCRNMAKNNIVFVSEYKVPKDFEKIYSIKSRTVCSDRIDNLYIV